MSKPKTEGSKTGNPELVHRQPLKAVVRRLKRSSHGFSTSASNLHLNASISWLAKDYGILPVPEWDELGQKTVIIRKMLCKLRAKVLESLKDEDSSEEDSDSEEDSAS